MMVCVSDLKSTPVFLLVLVSVSFLLFQLLWKLVFSLVTSNRRIMKFLFEPSPPALHVGAQEA